MMLLQGVSVTRCVMKDGAQCKIGVMLWTMRPRGLTSALHHQPQSSSDERSLRLLCI
jgi:hypothetical protein